MSQFRVALSGDFVKPDGAAAFPSFDLGPLDADPRIDWARRPPVGMLSASKFAASRISASKPSSEPAVMRPSSGWT